MRLILAVSLCFASTQALAAPKSEIAVLAGGCFWGTEALYEHVKGVQDVISGYAGGTRMGFGGPGGERTGFAEAVRIRYDPSQVSYEQLLQIFFMVAHDPTQVNRQGPDVGERYRSAIFPQNADQRRVAERYLAGLRASKRFTKPIATRIETGGFEIAEPEHQDFVRKHLRSQYVIVYDLPKLRELRDDYPNFWRS
jgi:peptide-methionine (S)-S-oxide reductase